jgi:hypothetical protein
MKMEARDEKWKVIELTECHIAWCFKLTMNPKMIVVAITLLFPCCDTYAFSIVVAVRLLVAVVTFDTDAIIRLDESFPHEPFCGFCQVNYVEGFRFWGAQQPVAIILRPM